MVKRRRKSLSDRRYVHSCLTIVIVFAEGGHRELNAGQVCDGSLPMNFFAALCSNERVQRGDNGAALQSKGEQILTKAGRRQVLCPQLRNGRDRNCCGRPETQSVLPSMRRRTITHEPRCSNSGRALTRRQDCRVKWPKLLRRGGYICLRRPSPMQSVQS